MPPASQQLTERLQQITAIGQASAVLYWDQATFMPTGGGAARGAQLAALAKLAHERATDPALGRLLDQLDDADPLVRVARRDYQRQICVPEAHVAEHAAHAAATYERWKQARAAGDFSLVADHLSRTVELSREYASFFPQCEHPADALIDRADPDVTVARLRPLFTTLRAQLVPLVQRVLDQQAPDASCLSGPYPADQQMGVCRRLANLLGYDYGRGRLDLTDHPFTTSFSIDDVRITTRYREDDLAECLFSTLHEAGHGMYEQGIDPAYEGTPLASGASSGLHESQSRLWENMVGRSLPFWRHYYPELQAAFPQQLAATDVAAFYAAINRVRRSLVRTDADELTYNLHVMLRFDLELALLEGTLAVADLPEAWAERMEADLGVRPQHINDGVLQDVHWFADYVGGAFQGYTLGNVMAAQLFAAAREADPRVDEQLARGEFTALRGWLTDKVYRHGRAQSADQTIQAASGAPLTTAPYMAYLTKKYTELYRLP